MISINLYRVKREGHRPMITSDMGQTNSIRAFDRSVPIEQAWVSLRGMNEKEMTVEWRPIS